MPKMRFYAIFIACHTESRNQFAPKVLFYAILFCSIAVFHLEIKANIGPACPLATVVRDEPIPYT